MNKAHLAISNGIWQANLHSGPFQYKMSTPYLRTLAILCKIELDERVLMKHVFETYTEICQRNTLRLRLCSIQNWNKFESGIFTGGSEAKLRKVFDEVLELSKKGQKIILYLKDVEQLARKRSGNDRHGARVCTQLLTLIDSIMSHESKYLPQMHRVQKNVIYSPVKHRTSCFRKSDLSCSDDFKQNKGSKNVQSAKDMATW